MAAEVRQKVLELYGHRDPAVMRAADAALREFQETELAWVVAQELLGDSDASVQFFAAQMLYSKVQQVAKGYQKMEGSALLELAPKLRGYLAGTALPSRCKHRLALALAALAVHLCSTAWPTAIADVLSLSAEQPQSMWCVLLAVPEQLASVVHNYLKTDRRTASLLAGAPAMVSAVLTLQLRSGGASGAEEEVVTGTMDDSAFSLALQSLTQWSKVMGLELLSFDGFAAFLAQLLASPAASSEPVLELLIEVLSSASGAFSVYADASGALGGGRAPAPHLEALLSAVVRTMGQLLPSLRQLAERPPAALDEADGARLGRWARAAFTLVEAYTQILWAESAAAEVVLSFLGACFLVHPYVAQSVFELWAVLKDASRDGKLPPGVLEGLLQRLTPPCVTSLARFGRLDSPHSEESATLLQLRDAQQDVIVDIFCISAGTSEAHLVTAQLLDHLQRAESSKDLHGVEVMWFAFNGIAEAMADEPALPDAFQPVVASVVRSEACTEDHCCTAAALLRSCGPHFERMLQPQLAPAVQWLMQRVPRAPAAASEAVQELCGYAGQHLVPHVAEFLSVVEASAPSAPPEVDAALHGALAGIARHLPPEQVPPAFEAICQGATKMLVDGLDVTQEPGRRTLHRCTCRLLRCTLVVEQAGGAAQAQASSAAGEPSMERRTAAACLANVLAGPVWPALASLGHRLLCAAPVARDAHKGRPIFEFSDEALQVNVLALLRYAAKAANDAPSGGPELCTHLLELAAACCKEGQLACLYAVAVLAGSDLYARQQVMPALEGICRAALGHAQAGRPAEQLVPFLELLPALATTLGDDFFASAPPALGGQLARLAAMALASEEQDILKPVLLYLQRLLTSRSPAISPAVVEEVLAAVLANFHRWPRAMGAQCFKVFSAFIERHEALFLSRALAPGAVPGVDGLPSAEQALARQAFQSLRGPRLRAFLGDLGAVARGDNSLDVLQAYGSTES